jgi:hypothetical protein
MRNWQAPAGSSIVESEMIFRRKDIPMGGMPGIPEFSKKIADPERIINIIKILKMIRITLIFSLACYLCNS